MDVFKTLLVDSPTVLASDGTGLLQASNNLSDVDDVSTARTNLDVYSKAENNARDFNRASAAQAVSDGSTTDRAIRFTATTRDDLTDASLATWAGFVSVPSSNPNPACYIFSGAASTTGSMFQAWTIGATIKTDGGLLILALGANTNTDRRYFEYSGFRAAYSGQVILLEVYFVSGTTDPVVRVNGVDISSNFVLSYGSGGVGTAPPWLSPSLADTYHVFGYNWPAGDAPLGCWINAALTDADRAYWLTHGVPPSWVLNGGSAVNKSTGVVNSSSSPWETFTSGSATGVTVVNSSTSARLGFSVGDFEVGVRYRVVFTANRNSGSTGRFVVKTKASVDASNSTGQDVGVLEGASGNFEREFTCRTAVSGGVITIETDNPSSGTWDGSFSGFKCERIGALGYPVPGPDRFVRDATRFAPPVDGYMVGMRPLSTDADGWIRGRRTTSGYLQADTQLVGDGRGVVQVLMRSVSGGTASLGESAGSTATVVASLTLTAGVWTPCTILKSVVSGGKLYAALGTATDVEVAVRTGPILSLA